MLLPSLTRKTLRDGRRALIGWTVGTGLFVLIYASSFSGFQDDAQTAQDTKDRIPDGVASLVGGIGDLSTGAGFLQAVVFQLFAPLLIVACAVAWGNSAVAAPEESGSLDVLMSLPMDRRRFLAERAAAIGVAVLMVAVAVYVIVLGSNQGLDMGVGFAEITAVCFGLLLIGLVFGAFALAVSAFIGRRAVVLAVTSIVALSTYLLRSLAMEHESISALRWLSPFQYYLGSDPLLNGFAWGHLAVLAALAAVLTAIALFAFERRDIGT